MRRRHASNLINHACIHSNTGDVTIQFRKQKKFPLYELEITLKWKGELWDAEGKVQTEAEGKVKIPDLSEETYDDLEMTTPDGP